MARSSRGFSESIGIWKCWFLRRGENRSTRRKTSRNKDENQQQTQPTFDAESGNRTRATLVGGLHGRQMFNHCAIPAPRDRLIFIILSRLFVGHSLLPLLENSLFIQSRRTSPIDYGVQFTEALIYCTVVLTM